MNRFFASWLFGRTSGMRHRMLSWPLALCLVLCLNAGSAAIVLAGLHFNNAPEVYYTPGSPAVLLRDELRRTFPYDEVLTVLFQGDGLYDSGFLRKLQAAVDALQRHPLVDRVSTVTSQERISGTDEGFEVGLLVDAGKPPPQAADAVRARVLGDRFAPGVLASRDGKHLAMVVRPKPMSQSAERVALKAAVAAAIDEHGLRPYYAGDAGPVTMDVAQLMSIFSDTAWLVPLTAGIGLALLAWVVGRWRPVLIGAVAMVTVVLPTVAGVVLSGQPYTMATAILPSLLSAYTVANLLHLYAAYQQAQRSSKRRSVCLDKAFAETRKPSAFNVLTTVAGLLSLWFVPMPPIQVFGVAGAAGTVLVFLTVHFLVPPFLRHWDRRPWPQHRSGLGFFGKLARRGALLSMRWPKTVLGATLLLMLALAPFLRDVRVETDLLAYFAPTHPVNVDTARIEAALGGVTPLEISLKAQAAGALQNVATLREIKRLQGWLDAQPEVDRTASMADLVEEMHWGMHQERSEFRAIPDTDRLLRQYLLVYDGKELYELVNRDFDHARIVLSLNVHGTQAIGQAIERIRARVAAEPIAGVDVQVGGYGRMLVDQVGLLVTGQLKSFAVAFAQIFLMMAVLWRSFKASAICMVPNLAPLFFFFVLMGAVGIPLDSATVMIASVVLGITVDDTIHLYHGYRSRLRKGMSPVFALARSYQSSGRAVLATSTVLIAQFGLLALSDFIPTANFGLVTAVGLLSGLAFEFLLPALLVLCSTAPKLSAAPSARRALVCHGDACRQAGAADVWQRLRDERKNPPAMAGGSVIGLVKTPCLGACRLAPVMLVQPGQSVYGLVDSSGLERIIAEHLRHGDEVKELVLTKAGPSGP